MAAERGGVGEIGYSFVAAKQEGGDVAARFDRARSREESSARVVFDRSALKRGEGL